MVCKSLICARSGIERYSRTSVQTFNVKTQLLTLSAPKTFNIATDLTAWYSGFGSSHNIVAHEEKNMIYAVGTARNSACKGGLFMLDVSNPAKPVSPGCVSQDGYVHDAQCVIYNGPDTKYLGKEICFNYNEDTVSSQTCSSEIHDFSCATTNPNPFQTIAYNRRRHQ